IEVIYHQAALPSVPRSVADPLGSHSANATGTLTLLEAARAARVRRFLYAGSSSVYGELPGLPKRESMETRPLSPYGVGKLVGEHYLRVYARLHGLEALTLRYFNVFGPRQDAGSPYSGVISLFITALLAGRTPVIYGDGKQTRDFTYVDNVVDANLRALTARGLRGQSVNVATGRRISLKALLKGVARETGRPARARHEPARAGDIRHSVADTTQARKLLGYRVVCDFEEGLRRTIDWYRQQAGATSARPGTRSSSSGTRGSSAR
ncbi:MAG TPA: NAD-dependent epimerase/dehydratase family protein, partial [Vicinamibacteria bacterium]|nr:NAD-dependent epimerase/dehydratase family protein [Vicinamibacteria bacterium]